MGWLTLTRALEDEIIIDHNIRIKVVAIDNHYKRVRLAINAPDNVLILRGEIKDDGRRRPGETASGA